MKIFEGTGYELSPLRLGVCGIVHYGTELVDFSYCFVPNSQ
jgi:hypothetical protein